jgi:uncharacterized protein with PQ loop repeat
MTVTQIAGILPAIVFPAATLAQLVRIVRSRSAANVSVATWLLFGFANLAIYVYAERYTEWQAILGMLVTAALDFAIVVLALAAFRRERFVAASPAATADASSIDFAWRYDPATGRAATEPVLHPRPRGGLNAIRGADSGGTARP